jgi:hypothetical protein
MKLPLNLSRFFSRKKDQTFESTVHLVGTTLGLFDLDRVDLMRSENEGYEHLARVFVCGICLGELLDQVALLGDRAINKVDPRE